uniref:Kinesin light chain n=1 Tax=Chaetoceros debilis TaxID=122233 RepID=A0A7S3V939_9STRA
MGGVEEAWKLLNIDPAYGYYFKQGMLGFAVFLLIQAAIQAAIHKIKLWFQYRRLKKEENIRSCGEKEREEAEKAAKANEAENKLRGISVFYLSTKFMAEVRGAGHDEHSTMSDLEDLRYEYKHGIIRRSGRHIICPFDGKAGVSYVNALALAGEGGDCDCDYKEDQVVGKATIFLNYSWGSNTIGDILDVLLQYCDSQNVDPKSTYVWISCLCMNQHRFVGMKRRGRDSLTSSLQTELRNLSELITNIGNVLVILAPLKTPAYLDRIWCLYEIYRAQSMDKGCEVTMIMPSGERADFGNGLSTNVFHHIDQLFKTLAHTSVEKAQATIDSDRQEILQLIHNGPGFKKFNATINNLIREWVLCLVLKEVEVKKEKKHDGGANGTYDESCANFFQTVGIFFHRIGEYDRSLTMYKDELEMVEQEFGPDHIRMTYPLTNMALVYTDQGKYDEAMQYYERALAMREKEYGKKHYETATTLHNMGIIYRNQKMFAKAVEVLNRAWTIRSKKYGRDHVITATTLEAIAIVLYDQKKYDEAMDRYLQVLSIYRKKSGRDSMATARVLGHIASSLKRQGKNKEAMVKYQQSLSIREKVLGEDHPETILTRSNIEKLKVTMGNR